MADIYQEIVEVKNKGDAAALVTVISTEGSTPRETGAKMLVKADGSVVGTIGGGNLEFLAIKEALKAIQTGKSKRLDYNLQPGGDTGMICGGDAEVFIEPILSAPSLYICGGGHIGLVLAKIGKLLGFRVIVIDDRPEYANAERFPDADQTVVSEYKDTFTNVNVDRSSYIVIATHGHKGDETALAGALGTPARYIGMIGSRKKVEAVYVRLCKKGFSREQLGGIHSPIGLDIYAQTPEEIAVSIIAEIIAARRTPPK
jgi:xanthine dehydrogenase accessory factor